MKVTVVSVMRNEADVVEIFVRHHAEFVDEIVVVDHMSLDTTGEILRELEAEGLPVTLREHDGSAFNQSNIVTAAVREAARERAADWIVPLDADEFVTSDADPQVRSVLEALDPETVHWVPWRTYVPHADDKPDEPHLHDRITHRRAEEGLEHGKVIIPGDLVRAQRLTVSHGNHHVRVRRRFKDRRVKSKPADDLLLAHFPVRLAEQVTLRALTAWPVRLARGALAEKHWGAHSMFERIAAGEVFHAEDLPELARHYAQRSGEGEDAPAVEIVEDPVKRSGEYTLARPGEPPAAAQVEQARAAIVRLRELVQIPANADDADIRAFVDEADALLAGSGTSN